MLRVIVIVRCQGLKVNVKRQRKQKCMCYMNIYCSVLRVVVVSFHGDVISCELARLGVQRGAAEASVSGGSLARVWAW